MDIDSIITNDKSSMVDEKNSLIFYASQMKHGEKDCAIPQELHAPLIDLGGFFSGDPTTMQEASRLVGEACKSHGFFLVVNHGVDENLISNAHRNMDMFFSLPLSEKLKAERKIGEHCGYASSFTGTFLSKLPWKETLSFQYSAKEHSSHIVEEYFQKTMGKSFNNLG